MEIVTNPPALTAVVAVTDLAARLKAVNVLAAFINLMSNVEGHHAPAKVRAAQSVMPVIVGLCSGAIAATADEILKAMLEEGERVYGTGLSEETSAALHTSLIEVLKV